MLNDCVLNNTSIGIGYRNKDAQFNKCTKYAFMKLQQYQHSTYSIESEGLRRKCVTNGFLSN